ncbi:ParB/RepB/Spo0J family partition protein [Streptomyces sp. DH12]|uniref:ParB/RepB/Spo0J family partition protein n=1 Tax=Streptomyces sp. DH12 TaxID=2857010 RepID=UPI001E48493B|nr:ParB/RepB/Spo0J family partition protein [Streptomyces sp. DH12]
MSKAKALGASNAFEAARSARSARSAAFDAAVGRTDTVVTKLPVTAISLNPENPRTDLGNLTELAGSLRDHGQKTAISIMSREAYLQANPDREADLEPDTTYVVVDGSSRLAAARKAGLTEIKVMLDDELGGNSAELLESALVANIHHRQLSPLDEAQALKKLLDIHGTQDALARHLHRSQGWVSQRLTLLNLTPELQARLEAGEEKAELLRRVGNKKPEEQEQHLARLKAEETRKAAARKTGAAAVPSTQQVSPAPDSPTLQTARADADHYGVMTRDTAASTRPAADLQPSPLHVPGQQIQPTASQLVAQGTAVSGPAPTVEVSPDDPAEGAARLFTGMSQEQRVIFLAHFLMHMKKAGGIEVSMEKAGELDSAGTLPFRELQA